MVNSSPAELGRRLRCAMCGEVICRDADAILHLAGTVFAHEECARGVPGGGASTAKRMILQASAGSLCRPNRSPLPLRRG